MHARLALLFVLATCAASAGCATLTKPAESEITPDPVVDKNALVAHAVLPLASAEPPPPSPLQPSAPPMQQAPGQGG